MAKKKRITDSSLRNDRKLFALYQEAISRGWWDPNVDDSFMLYVACADMSLRKADERGAAGLFIWLTKRRPEYLREKQLATWDIASATKRVARMQSKDWYSTE